MVLSKFSYRRHLMKVGSEGNLVQVWRTLLIQDRMSIKLTWKTKVLQKNSWEPCYSREMIPCL